MRTIVLLIIVVTLLFSCSTEVKKEKGMGLMKISANGRFFTDENGDPFFWLGDTGWLLFSKLNREEAVSYLDNRVQKGYNVIQIMVLHSVSAKNVYGDSALVSMDVDKPLVTEGNSFAKPEEYDYWDHIDFVIHEAEKRGLYVALVPVWGGNVKSGFVTCEQAAVYGKFIAERYKNLPNIIWLNGGDILGSDSIAVWNMLGKTINVNDSNHLITFHPRGRKQSSMWFHQEEWLDFNMFQSGHRRYDQDDSELAYGEDNWRYVEADYNLKPVKPTFDGEPSYEGIPQGLHDTLQPFWTDADARRYAYWSVFSGACGYTYGHSSVMQFYKPEDTGAAYGAKKYWTEAINDPGAGQMVYLKNLLLSRSYFDRVPDQSIVAEQPGDKYDYQVATRGKDYAFVYTYNGRNMKINMGKIQGEKVKCSWLNPRNGKIEEIGSFPNKEVLELDPPGEVANGNDWVLIIDSQN